MANKKQNTSVITGSTRVLRPRTPSTGYANVDDRSKMKVAKATGKLKVGDAGKSDIPMKRKAMDDEGAGNRAKKVKAINKNEMDKSAASGSTRVLRSSGGLKVDEVKKEVAKTHAKAKTRQEIVEANMSSAGKGSCPLTTDFTGSESTGKRVTRSATKDQGAVQASTPTRKNTMRKGKAAVKTN